MSFDVQEVLPDAPAALPVPDAADLGRPDLLIRSMAISQMLGVVCDAGVPDALAPFESRAATAIAAELGLNEQVCLRVLRALSTFQYFRVDAEGNVRHNERSLLLRSDRVPSYASAARFWASAGVWQAWGQLRHALRTGSESFRRAHEMQFFDYMATHPAESDIYNSYMACGYPGRHQALASIMNCPDDGLVIDVGGGTGSLMKAVLERHLSVRAIVLDTEATATQGAAQLDAELADRLSFCRGDFFGSVPENGDVYVLSWILHDWPDAQAQRILESCRAAMRRNARLVIAERLIADNPARCDPCDLILDINMLVLHGGQERRLQDFDRLLANAGFAPPRILKQQATFSVLETHPG